MREIIRIDMLVRYFVQFCLSYRIIFFINAILCCQVVATYEHTVQAIDLENYAQIPEYDIPPPKLSITIHDDLLRALDELFETHSPNVQSAINENSVKVPVTVQIKKHSSGTLQSQARPKVGFAAALQEDDKILETSSDNVKIEQGTHVYNYSKRTSRPDDPYNRLNHFWKQDEVVPSAEKLTRDAVSIAHHSKDSEHCTILCTALRNKEGYVERFVFHNGLGVMGPSIRKEAAKLGYDIIKTRQSHAELGLLQFLSANSGPRNDPSYTHLVAMGCNRLHCIECDYLLGKLIAKAYHSVTAAWQGTYQEVIGTYWASSTRDANCLKKISHHKGNIYIGQEAVSVRKTANFYVPFYWLQTLKGLFWLDSISLACSHREKSRYISPQDWKDYRLDPGNSEFVVL
ncbi:MAG: hypothetical protein AAFU83_03170, partial [Bacteroidota bacterium]